jgi:hypothetical protein
MPRLSLGLGVQTIRKVGGGATPPAGTVSLLLHMNGTNASTNFIDSSLNGFTVTANGDAQISTAQSKYGGASGYFDGGGDYLSVVDSSLFNFDLEDFTIETWLYMQGEGLQIIVAKWDAAGTNAWQIYYNDGDLVFQSSEDTFLVSGSITSSQWTHLAITRQGTSLRFFIDGNLIDTLVCGDDLSGTADLSIAANDINNGEGGANFYMGYMDDLRIIKGEAKYTASFTPPTSQLPNP